MKVLATAEGFYQGTLRQRGELFEVDDAQAEPLGPGMVALSDDVPAPARDVVMHTLGGRLRLMSGGRLIYPPADAMADVAAHFGEDA